MAAKKFQLTTSRRGRPAGSNRPRPGCHFNSLPHAEVDAVFDGEANKVLHFNSLPHAEVDTGQCYRCKGDYHFNSLPHAEVDR